MGVLSALEPKKVFEFFEAICAIPHGSGHTKQISDYCVRFAENRGLAYHQDELNNVVIYKNAVGCTASESVILQGHLDMVCKKRDELDFNFLTQRLRLAVEGDWINAQGTTLGGDDGVAVAIALAILDSDNLVHPPLEVVFTVDEETGMDGADGIDGSLISGRRMINIDSEEEGILTVSCAGGCRANCTLPARRIACELPQYRITVSGLVGGHSGTEINRGRASSNQLLGRLLSAAYKKSPFFIVDIFGGTVDNAIPSLSWAEIAVWDDGYESIAETVREYNEIFRSEYAVADPDICISIEPSSEKKPTAVSGDHTENIIKALVILPYGVQVMSMDIEGLVQTSLNLGIMNITDESCCISFSIRSSIATQKRMLIERVQTITELLGGSVELYGDYPSWEYRHDSPLRDIMVQTWADMYGAEPQVVAIHAGLECGLFSGKLEGLDAVSCGPNILDIHSPNERLSISSTARIYNYIVEILRRLAK